MGTGGMWTGRKSSLRDASRTPGSPRCPLTPPAGTRGWESTLPRAGLHQPLLLGFLCCWGEWMGPCRKRLTVLTALGNTHVMAAVALRCLLALLPTPSATWHLGEMSSVVSVVLFMKKGGCIRVGYLGVLAGSRELQAVVADPGVRRPGPRQSHTALLRVASSLPGFLWPHNPAVDKNNSNATAFCTLQRSCIPGPGGGRARGKTALVPQTVRDAHTHEARKHQHRRPVSWRAFHRGRRQEARQDCLRAGESSSLPNRWGRGAQSTPCPEGDAGGREVCGRARRSGR